MSKFAVAIGFLLAIVPGARAHPGHDHGPELRVWKDADGVFEIEGSFVQAREDRVQLRKHDGVLVWIPFEKLSEPDRGFIRERVAAVQRLNGGTARAEISSTTEIAREEPNAGLPIVAGVFALVVLAGSGAALRRRFATGTVAALILSAGMCGLVAEGQDAKKAPAIQKHFEPFKDTLKFRADDTWFYVESNGIPDHRMMVGITAWQQQVPIAQAYAGRNAWQIPLNPKFADKPVSAKSQLFRGAIALAANGVPIFNPIKNDGKTDTFLAGELDEFGGHCGRGDDYHYHTGPVHLEKVVGKGNPIGYALDGYPLYGYLDADGNEPKNLDEFNGRMEKDGYRYYSTKKYPYVNGGLRGVVTVKEDQIDPQPRANSPRPSLPPLRGAKITGFERDEEKKTATVTYDLGGKANSVKYTQNADGSYTFVFTDGAGKQTTETYRGRPGGKDGPKKDGPPPKKDGPPKKDDNPPKKDEPAPAPKLAGTFKLTSPAFEHNGKMPAEFTGDGDGISPPLKWSGAPEGTKFYALQLWHKPKADADEVKSYWVIINIPASVTSLEKNTKGVGKDGYNDKKRTGYDPMNSKGPGVKEYHITMYALSEEPKFDTDKVTRADLLKAVKGITLAETTLSYTHERKPK